MVGVQIQLNTARQEKPHWCWAACIEAIFDFHGYQVSQEAVVEKVFGGDVDRPAGGREICASVNGRWNARGQKTFDARAEVLWDAQIGFGRPDAVVQAARELESNNPLIVGALGHATVLTAMTYSATSFGARLEEIVIRDPWPLNPNRRTFTQEEAMQTQFLAQIHVS
jgi:hypothetical protein